MAAITQFTFAPSTPFTCETCHSTLRSLCDCSTCVVCSAKFVDLTTRDTPIRYTITRDRDTTTRETCGGVCQAAFDETQRDNIMKACMTSTRVLRSSTRALSQPSAVNARRRLELRRAWFHNTA